MPSIKTDPIVMESILKTDIGLFRIKISEYIDYDIITREAKKVGYTIGIGGKKDTCVFITVMDGSTIGKLHNLRIRGLTCEISGLEMRGKHTVHMVNLLFSVIKNLLPHIKYIELDDESEFPCKDKERTYGMSLALYELAFHRETWYERHFGAELKNNQMKNLYIKDGFYNKKPITYNFRHSLLNEKLSSLYESTATWKDFFDELYKYDEKCKLMIPWYKDALRSIMNGISFESQTWLIDLSHSKVENISYTVIKNGGGCGSKRTTRKWKKYNYNNMYDYLENPAEIQYNETDFLKN